MSTNINLKSLCEFYEIHLNEVILPFWMKNSIDRKHGGYFTCFDNSGSSLVGTDKYTWSQGRMVWVLSKLSIMNIYTKEQQEDFLGLAKSGAEFLMKYCLLPNGNCTFLMDRSGNPIVQYPGAELDSSFYADCFVVLGLTKYSIASGNKAALDFAIKLFDSIYERVETGTFKSEPYPSPVGFRMHGPSMIMLNVCCELSDALAVFKHNRVDEVNKKADYYMHNILDNFVSENNLIHEMINPEKGFVTDTLMGRYINPGHTIEDMWFVIHQALKSNNLEVIKKACDIIKKTFETGWDKEYGGLQLFADMDGGQPKGSIAGYENDKMVQKVQNDWSSKLWWPHSESLYSLLLAYYLTDDEKFLQMHNVAHDYIFSTFPNPDKTIGEWIQIRNRIGTPEKKVVALPVKDPFHITRNLILIIDLLGKKD